MDGQPLIDIANINEKVYAYLKKGIISLQYHPGQKLNIKELQKILGVSPTPIKDALFRLAGEGLVEINSRQGTYVKDIKAKDIRELLQTRMVLETGALDLTNGKISAEQLAVLRERFQDTLTVEGEFEYRDYMAKDHLFHLAIVALAGNDLITEMYNRMNSHMQVVRFRYAQKVSKKLPWADQDHSEIFSALEHKDFPQAKAFIRSHIDKSAEAFVNGWN